MIGTRVIFFLCRISFYVFSSRLFFFQNPLNLQNRFFQMNFRSIWDEKRVSSQKNDFFSILPDPYLRENESSFYFMNHTHIYYDQYIDSIYKLKIGRRADKMEVYLYPSKVSLYDPCKIKETRFGRLYDHSSERKGMGWKYLYKKKIGFYWISLCKNNPNLESESILFLVREENGMDLFLSFFGENIWKRMYPLSIFIKDNHKMNTYNKIDFVLNNYSFVQLYVYFISWEHLFFFFSVYFFLFSILFYFYGG